MIHIYEPTITKYSKSAIDAINSGWISNHGKYIELANQNLCKTLDSKYSVLLSNGTCATHCLFLAIQYKHPEITKIYVPNNAYVAAWNSALMVYNINQLEVMKMNINTWNIETNEEYFKTLEKNSAVVIVHLSLLLHVYLNYHHRYYFPLQTFKECLTSLFKNYQS
jgi:dTDP-4-amino-4,6-dideoxygalactose transaminase